MHTTRSKALRSPAEVLRSNDLITEFFSVTHANIPNTGGYYRVMPLPPCRAILHAFLCPSFPVGCCFADFHFPLKCASSVRGVLRGKGPDSSPARNSRAQRSLVHLVTGNLKESLPLFPQRGRLWGLYVQKLNPNTDMGRREEGRQHNFFE